MSKSVAVTRTAESWATEIRAEYQKTVDSVSRIGRLLGDARFITEEEVQEWGRQLSSGLRGPMVRRWLRRLQADRDLRARMQRAASELVDGREAAADEQRRSLTGAVRLALAYGDLAMSSGEQTPGDLARVLDILREVTQGHDRKG